MQTLSFINGRSKSSIKRSIPFIEAERAEVPFLYHELLECDHNGLNHNIPNHDISLIIPGGAVSKGEKIHFELGITMYGPFSFTESIRPISPIIWLCLLEEEYQLMAPFQLALPHYYTDDKSQHHEVRFAKAEHSYKEYNTREGRIQYKFHLCDFQPVFDDRNRAILATKHFCFYCLSSARTHEPDKRIRYCLAHVKVSPSEATFFATYFVPTCLQVSIYCVVPGKLW